MAYYERLPLEMFKETFGAFVELSSVALNGKVVSVSDEFFAEAYHLLLVEPAPSMKGQFGPNGALFSGWESRRHNPTHDWCIVKLGISGSLIGFDVDTANFNGNEAPQVSIDALYADESEEPTATDSRWSELVPCVDLGPNSRHLFKIAPSPRVNFVKLNMFPDGGIARFRVYGNAHPDLDDNGSPDLAHVFSGGRVVDASDQHFGVGSNLLLPGRGKDMSDGWETKRSRKKGHYDWVVIKLGMPGLLEYVNIDTANFKGNFPESCEMHALFLEDDNIDWKIQNESLPWIEILSHTKLGPHREHYLQLENVEEKPFTHVKVTIFPDGGLKRVRIIGRKVDSVRMSIPQEPPLHVITNQEIAPSRSNRQQKIIKVLPLTPEAFAPFGQVIQSYADHAAIPKGIKLTPANAGTATKFHKQALLTASYKDGSRATPRISVYRCNPCTLDESGTLPLTVLERHTHTNQAFIPMGSVDGTYLVVVAQNISGDRPDINSLRAFRSTAAQGIMYNAGIWHQPMTVLDNAMDLACVETQIGDGSTLDCEILEVDHSLGVFKLQIIKLFS